MVIVLPYAGHGTYNIIATMNVSILSSNAPDSSRCIRPVSGRCPSSSTIHCCACSTWSRTSDNQCMESQREAMASPYRGDFFHEFHKQVQVFAADVFDTDLI